MKIAIVGNVNNNGFALMRYLRDLGADAHLLLYANDGVDSLAHFRPESDTWHIDRWRPFIHQTNIVNGLCSALPDPLQRALKLWHSARHYKGKRVERIGSSARDFRHALARYDKVIGSGISAALGYRAGMPLDVFFPYSTGVEFLGSQALTSRLAQMGPVRRTVTTLAIKAQCAGVRAAHAVVTAEHTLTKTVLSSIDVVPISLPIPMVYCETAPYLSCLSGAARQTIDQMRTSRMVLSCARQLWRNPGHMSQDEWARESKNSDWLIRGFAELVAAGRFEDTTLGLTEYGPDVSASKALCDTLGIANRVAWIPKLPRREVLALLPHAFVIVGEFKQVDEMLWGGTGWEALSAGRPLVHSFRFADGRFEAIYGMPRPPVCAVSSATDVPDVLSRLLSRSGEADLVGQRSKRWFDEYCGAGLAAKWLALLNDPTSVMRPLLTTPC